MNAKRIFSNLQIWTMKFFLWRVITINHVAWDKRTDRVASNEAEPRE